MKPATCLLLPLLATGLAACGSAQTSQPPSTAHRADAPPLPYQPRTATPKATGTGRQDRATEAAPGEAAATAQPNAKAKGKGRAKGAPATPPVVAVPHSAELGVSAEGVIPGGIVVGARAGFEITLRSFDSKAHRVKLATPTPRAVNVPANEQRPARIKLPGLAPGAYSVAVDGKRGVGALLVIDPSRSRSRGRAPAPSAK